MSLRIYNTLSRHKETFEPVEPGKVGMYLCGPTVYKPPHVGHMVGPIIFDAIKRWLTHRGYDVTFVSNITDIEDKLINKANELGQTVDSLVDKYGAEYNQALARLGIDTLDHQPYATQYIAEMITLIERLIERGMAYVAEGNVWFDVSESPDYGKLSGRRPDEMESTERGGVAEGKTDPRDFGLWKAAKPGEPSWPSPWGNGRPGWHIECSAMSMKLLGESFDIHGGGLDLVFPHHENEIAQSEGATGKPFVKYWVHNGLTRMKTKASSGEWKDEKMSGSIGNVISAADFFEQHGPQTLRYVILATHYRSPIDFHDEVIEASKKGMANFARTAERLAGVELGEVGGLAEAVAEAERKFAEAMDDDFNTAGAIAALHGLNNAIAKQTDDAEAAAAAQTLGKLGALIGLDLMTPPQHDDLTGKLLDLFVELRLQRREAKDFATSDAIRDRLADLGVTLEDGKDGTTWHIG
ncbi:MAG: cysteine--tRNA ligase [Planctomycetota bacterium]